MVDFTKRIHNSNKFRQPALEFLKTGQYCQYPKGTTEYINYWLTEQDRCINGYTADDGDFISGYNYFYLNYCPINRIVNKEVNGKVKSVSEVTFPDFWDYDYYYFQTIEEAQEQGKHLCVLKSRRKGYSYKCAAMLCRNYYLIPNSASYVYASNKQYLTDDGVLTKSWNYMDFIDEHTAWGKKRTVNTQLRRRAGMWVKDEYGNQIEVGYKSEIIGVTLKDNPDVVRGKKANLIMFEEAGSFKELSAAWQIARPSVEIDGKAFGTMIAYGTGGDEESNFFTLKDMFYHPEGYNCLPLPNIWDEHVANTECGFFIPQYTNMDLRDEQGKRLYMDDDGNTLISPAKQYILEERRKVIEHSTSSIAVDRYVAERPITPAEACLEFNGNIFPKKELQEQLGKIRTNKLLQNRKQVGDLIWESNGSLKWLPKKSGDITHYPLNKNDDPTGSIVIWEHPVKDAPIGLYIMGCLTPGEKVLTDKGLINVEDVDFTYKLVNKDGNLDRIINLQRYNKVNEPVFRIKPAGSYRTTQFTGEHPILLSDNTFIKAKDLKVGDELVIPNRFACTKNNYKTIIEDGLGIDPDDHRLWRFLGIWLGDGFNNINRNSYDIYVAFGKEQIAQAEEYSKLILNLFQRKTIWCKSNGGQTRRFTHKKLVEFLNTHFGKYAENKRIPEWAMYIPEPLKRSFLLGYLDSDGSVFKDRKHYKVTYTSINLNLLEQVQQLLYSISICSSINLKQKAGNYLINQRIQHKQDSYCLKIASQDTLNLLDNAEDVIEGFKVGLLRMYDRTKLSNRPRYASVSEDRRYIYLKIQDIQTSLYTGVVYNFECESHTYMCHDIVSHNCDPYDHDQSGTNSLGSVFVYKRFQNFENYYDLIVAEYTGRPSTAEEFYENVRKLAIYYNARIMYENQNKGLFPYFVAKHCDYLLADQPDILNDIISNTKVNRKKGCHMNKQIKQWGEGLIKDWLNEEKAPGHKNLHDILSEPLLEELISYNDIGNFDRCLVKDTLITTENGYKKVQDIKVGDKVLTDTGQLKNVTWIDRHVHNGFKAKLRLMGDYRTLECTDNHPILVAYTDKKTHRYRKDSLNNITFLRADSLTKKYQFGKIPKRDLCEQVDLSDDVLYLLGWIMSDGYIDSTNGIKITYQINQLECAKKCSQIIEDYLKDEIFYYSKNNRKRIIRKPSRIYRYKDCYRLEVHSKKLHSLAEWFGCKPNNKCINFEIYNRYNNLMPFVIGWLEGDGHQKLNANYDGYNRNCIEISTIYENLLLQCRQIMIDHGIYSSIRKIKSRLGKQQVSLCFSNEYINRCLDYYPSLKFQKINTIKNTSKVLETEDGFWSQIQLLDITPINEEVYNFEVQDDHTYVANGITTHNCMALIQVMIYREQLYNVVVKEKKKQNKSRLLFDGPIFNQDAQYDDTMYNVDENVYTFN